MIYIYGDSHGDFSFKNLVLPNINKSQHSITMFRISRDNLIINFDNNEHDNNSIICLSYGEIDCRFHVLNQVKLGNDEDIVINNLVHNYFETIKNNIKIYKKIVVVGVIPPTSENDYCCRDPTHPFMGSDDDRIRVNKKINNLLKEYCNNLGFCYFNPYIYYTRDNGLFKHELSDTTVHLGDNTYFLEKFIELYNSIINE
jgi:hypothetical protein